MTATLLPPAKSTFVDLSGVPLANGSVTFYIPGTTTLKDTWQDAAETILNTNPIALDERGQAVIWGSGFYRQIVKDALGVTIWDQITGGAFAQDDLSNVLNAASQIAAVNLVNPTARAPDDRLAQNLAVAGQDFGVPWDGTAAAQAINSIVLALGERGGGVIDLPMTVLFADASIDIPVSNVVIRGCAGQTIHTGGPQPIGTTVVPTISFDDYVLKVRSPYGATKGAQVGSGFQNMRVIGNSLGRGALLVDSCRTSDISVTVEEMIGGLSDGLNTAVLIKSGLTGTNLAEAADVQRAVIKLSISQIQTTAAKLVDCCHLLGSTNADPSLFDLYLDMLHWSGHGLVSDIADNVFVKFLRAFRAGGAGEAYIARASNTAPGSTSNWFGYVSHNSTFRFEGTDTGKTYAANGHIDWLDKGNGAADPTLGTACKVTWSNSPSLIGYRSHTNVNAVRLRTGNNDFALTSAIAAGTANLGAVFADGGFGAWTALLASGGLVTMGEASATVARLFLAGGVVGLYNNGYWDTSSGYRFNGVQVAGARATGWTAATGTATRTTFATGAVTLPQLAEHVKALIDDLITHGLIGT